MTQKENAQPAKAELSAPDTGADITTASAVPAIRMAGGDAPRVDSRLLALRLGVLHKNSMELLTGPSCAGRCYPWACISTRAATAATCWPHTCKPSRHSAPC